MLNLDNVLVSDGIRHPLRNGLNLTRITHFNLGISVQS